MDNFFGTQVPGQDLQQQLARQSRDGGQTGTRTSGNKRDGSDTDRMQGVGNMGGRGMMGGDSLDDIIRSNHQELQRRRSIPQPFIDPNVTPDGTERRMPMMEFNGQNDGFQEFHFSNEAMTAAGFGDGLTNLNTTNNFGMPNSIPNFGQQGMLDMGEGTGFSSMSPTIMGSMMPASFANMTMGQLGNGSSMDMFSPNGMPYAPTPIASDFMDLNSEEGPINNTTTTTPGNMNMFANPNTLSSKGGAGLTLNTSVGSLPQTVSQPLSGVSPSSLLPGKMESSRQPSKAGAPSTPKVAMGPEVSPRESKEKSIYSKSGFDMVKALWYVGARQNPEIHLGSVDFSCAFVVCDTTMNDCPIIYVSDNFQNLTGYNRHEIIGKNCRFLQAPDAKVEAGTKREFVDNAAVYNLKKKIAERKEVQQSLINYRKGGKPFLNLLTMIPIPWETEEIRYYVGFQIDLVECPDALSSGQDVKGVQVNYKHSDIGQYIWTPPNPTQFEPENGQTLGVDDVSALLQQFNPKAAASDWLKQSWEKMLLENTDDVVHVLSLKGLFLYLSPSCKRLLEYDVAELVGQSLSTICHPSDIVPVTRELKDTTINNPVNLVFRIRRKQNGYMWFESHGSLFVEQGKGRKCIILVGRKRPVYTLRRRDLDANGGIGEAELWSKISTSGMFLYVSSNVRSLLDLQPENLVGTSIQELMRKESRLEFGRSIEKARRGRTVTCKHEVQNRRGQVLQAQTVLYPGDATEGQKPTFILAQTKLLKASSRTLAPASQAQSTTTFGAPSTTPGETANAGSIQASQVVEVRNELAMRLPDDGESAAMREMAAATDDNIFDEMRTTKCSSWQFELRQMEKVNRILAEELGGLLSNKKKRKRRKGVGNVVRDCANCHTRNTPEWRRGPSGQRDLCNSCGLRWAKQTGRVSPRNSSRGGNGDTQSKLSNSPVHSSPLHREVMNDTPPQGDTSQTAPTSLDSGTESVEQALKPHGSVPPPSQPLLEGGSNQEMTSIMEERESSMP